MKNRRSFNPIILSAMFVGLYVLTGCGMSTTTSSGDPTNRVRVGAWTIPGTPLDSSPSLGAGLVVTPQIAVQPNGGGSAMAVWIEQVDLNPADNLPAVYHLFAKRCSDDRVVVDAGTSCGDTPSEWASTDSGCPFGNPDATGDDGICQIDTGKAQYDAWSPKVSMDDNGDAVVVWQQHDGTATRVYARRFSGGSWGAAQQLNDSIEFTNFDAGDPAIALEPDPANNGGTDDGAGSAMATWSQYNQKDWVQVFNSDINSGNLPASPTTAIGTNWTAPANVTSSDNAYAVYNNTLQDDLCATNFGFSIPVNTTVNGVTVPVSIRGIEVSVEGHGTSAVLADRQFRVGLTKSGCSLAGARKTNVQVGQTADTWTSVGDLDDLWATDWAPADINAASFGVLISDNDTTAAELDVDNITVTIFLAGMNCSGSNCGSVQFECPGGANNNCASIRSMTTYSGRMYVGVGGSSRGSADVYSYDGSSNTWSLSLSDDDAVNGYEQVMGFAVYNGKLYAGLGSISPARHEGDLKVYDGNTWSLVSTNAGLYSAVRSMAVYQCSTCPGPQLYLGMGDSNTGGGAGDVLRCTLCDGTPGDLQTVLDNPNNTFFAVTAMGVYNNQLYIGLRGVLAPNLAVVRRCSVCNGTDWQTVYTSATYDSVRSMVVYNNQLYWGFGDSDGDGDIIRCTVCDGVTALDQQLVLDSPGTGACGSNATPCYEAVLSMLPYNGFLYIGLGTPGISGTANRGDIKRCRVCDGTDWSYSRDDTGTYEGVPALTVYNGDLYGGFAVDVLTDGDIFRYTAGWQTVARRFVNGVGWDVADTICPAGSGLNDGICYVSGVLAAVIQPSQTPRVKADNLGRSIVAFIQMIQQSDCFVPPTVDPSTVNGGIPGDVNNVTILQVPCMTSSLQANFYDGTSWQSPIDLSPDANLGGNASFTAPGTPGSVAIPQQLICFQAGDSGAATRTQISSSNSCVNIVDFDLAMDTTGETFLLIQTSWALSEDFAINNNLGNGTCGGGDHTGNCNPDGFADQYYQGMAIVAREYTMASPWSAANWSPPSNGLLANFGIYPVLTPTTSTPTVFGTGPFAGGCPSATSLDVDRSILNCKFRNPHIAIEPDGGGTALAVYESYNGTGYDIQTHRFNGAAWSGSTTIDAGGGDAHAPQIAMDNSGNGVAVWTQTDGTKFRIYSNCFAPAAGAGTCGNVVSTGWQGATNMDGDVGSESEYYSPVVDLAAPGGANSALSLFLGWSMLDNFTRLYAATGP